MSTEINFPNLNIYLENVGKSINIFGYEIAYYGIVIAIGMILGVSLVMWMVVKDGLDADAVFDLALVTIILGVIGARVYYVVFSWEYYKDDLISVFNVRQGGLAIYGGILFGMFAVILMCRIKRISFFRMGDIAVCGVLVGQICGRWGNFFNREVFGGYTNNIFAMELPLNAIRSMSDVTDEMLENARVVDDVTYIQVHPTFLYESLWNVAVLIILLLFFKYFRRFYGQMTCLYMILYGVGRIWIEAVRTDQLMFLNTGIPVSQIVAVLLILSFGTIYAILFIRSKKKGLLAVDSESCSEGE